MKFLSSAGKRASRALALVLSLMLLLTMTAAPALAADSTADPPLFEYYDNGDGTAELTGYYGQEKQLEIPAEIDGKKITEIGWRAFESHLNLESVTIPEGVTYIGKEAFYDCWDLKNITISKSVILVDDYAFGYYLDRKLFNQKKVVGVKITGYKNSGAYKYAMRNSFEFVSIGEVSPFVYDELDDGTVEITHYNGYEIQPDIPIELGGKKVTSIGYHAFENCTSIESITIPDGVTSIGDYAFEDCSYLKSVTLPKSLTHIGALALGYDGSYSFHLKVYGFKIIGYKNSVAYRYAMENDFEFVSLGDVSPFVYDELDDETVEITRYNGYEAQLDIPAEIDGKKVTSIGNVAFEGCTNLKNVTIPGRVTSIGNFAFDSCPNLKTVIIPKSVTSIGNLAFGYYMDKELSGTEKVDAFTIKGYAGTEAERYAKDNGFEFIALDNVMLGDVDNNGSVTIADAIMVQKHIVSILTLTGDQITVADVDKNGEISIADAIMIQKDIVGIIDINAA